MKTINVVAAVIVRDGRILATCRGYGDMKGGWEFPGGKIEAGESCEAALVREIREELDVTVDPVEHLCTVEYDYPTFHLSMACFLSKITEGELHLNEHQDARWLRSSELDEPAWLPADVEVVGTLKQRLARAG